ncbi:MAG: VCBS repeat-containing protein [Pseudomonadota bacterium]
MGTAAQPETLGGLFCVTDRDGTQRYPHGVLGDTWEPTRLTGRTADAEMSLRLEAVHVFEDLAPRLADLDGDGSAEIITIRSHRNFGAQLAIYGPDPANETFQLIAATPYIGRPNRWLAPIGVADFNADGLMDIAYVDRPHLARTLRVWTFEAGALREIASAGGFSNHRIGEDFITGGVRNCGAGPEMVIADAGWTQVMVARMENGAIIGAPVAPFSTEAIAAALACR